jgi:hypothetical protein
MSYIEAVLQISSSIASWVNKSGCLPTVPVFNPIHARFVCMKNNGCPLALEVQVEVTENVRTKDNRISMSQAKPKSRLQEAKISSFTPISDNKNHAELQILPISMNACSDVEVDNKSSKRISGSCAASRQHVCK